MLSRVFTGILLCGMPWHSAFAQVVSSGPVPGLLSAAVRQVDPRVAAESAKQSILQELRSAGGGAANRALVLQSLPASKVLERLAVFPAVGPSTIAPPKPGAPTPSPSVNNSEGGGATTEHAGVALLLARKAGQDKFVAQCSGTLIRQNVVLTAAHCVCFAFEKADNYPTGSECAKGTETRAPASLTDKDNWRVFFQHVGMKKVSRVVVNEGYRFDGTAVRDDLALLVLEEPVVEIIPPALPPGASQALPWSVGRIIGYGFSSADESETAVLKMLVQPGIKSHGRVNYTSCQDQTYLDPAGSLCSLFSDTANGSPATVCGGDSGGPLWHSDTDGSTIGVTSGRSHSDCQVKETVGFQMATSYQVHREWIEKHLSSAPSSTSVKGKWPAFGGNLRDVLDRRNSVPFDESGIYESEAWIRSKVATPILATINSSGAVAEFSVRDRKGKVLCRGAAGATGKLPNVDFCWAKVPAGAEFRIVARGTKDQFLQYVVSTHASLPK